VLFLCLFIIVPLASAEGWRAARSLEGKAETGGRVMVRTVAMTPENMVLDYALPVLKAVPAANDEDHASGAVRPVMGNAPHRSTPGLPVLPVVPASLVLPAGYDLDDIYATPGATVTLPGSYLVEHGQTPFPLIPGIRPPKTEKNRAVYESDAPFPGRLFDVAGVYKKRGVSILMINLHPVVYRPGSGSLAWYKTLTLTVKTKPAVQARGNKLPYRPSAPGTLEKTVENPEMLDTYTDQKKTALPEAGGVYPRAGARYVLITSQAIIDDTSINPSVADFIGHARPRA